jgi:hypothetical protein
MCTAFQRTPAPHTAELTGATRVCAVALARRRPRTRRVVAEDEGGGREAQVLRQRRRVIISRAASLELCTRLRWPNGY